MTATTPSKLFISGLPLAKLPRSVHQIKTEIKKFMQPYHVKDVRLIHNRDYHKGDSSLKQRKFMNYCIVDMETSEEASRVILDKNGITWLESVLRIEHCKEQKDKKQSVSRGGKTKKSIAVLEEDVSPVFLADIGANLTSKRFKNDLNECMQRAKDCNVIHMYITGTSWNESKNAVDLARKWAEKPHVPGISMYATCGIHPHAAKTYQKDTFRHFKSLIQNNRDIIVAVGETGLDYNRMFSTKVQQIASFEAHIELAIQLQMPLFLHERDAHEDFIRVLRKKGKLPPVCVHCFTGTAEQLKVYVQEGFYIGITGFINLEQRASHLYDHLGIIPQNRLLVETDAPYMLPFENSNPRKSTFNTRCEPFLLNHIVRKIAELRGESAEELGTATFENTHRFFGTTMTSCVKELDSNENSSSTMSQL